MLYDRGLPVKTKAWVFCRRPGFTLGSLSATVRDLSPVLEARMHATVRGLSPVLEARMHATVRGLSATVRGLSQLSDA